MSSNKKSSPFLIGALFGLLLSASGVIIAERGAMSGVPFDELKTFTEVFGRIQKDYVEPVSDKKILEDAIRGMLSGLDPHSTYLDEEQYNELRVGTTGQFGGLGIEVGLENGFIKVISPIDDTPAQKAGVQPGDLIIRLDEKPVKGMSLEEAVKIMRGEPGSSITLTVVRESEEQPLTITIVRDVINVKSVKSRLLEDGYGYIRITSFQSKTAENLTENLLKLETTNKGKLKGLVLDLRNNPGGVLNAAVAVSDAFLTGGLIVYTEGRVEDSQYKFRATPKEYLDGAPIVVLINAGSASASEIVAGALQDQNRAIIMGEKSFGKGSVQTILPTSNGGAVKLTTARYYTPSGRSIQAEGITPDIILSKVRLQEIEKSNMNPVTESDLSNHLTNATPDEGAKQKNDVDSDQLALTNDYPLSEALNVLKGINISRAGSKN
ncbi:MAG: S41 family peptidase [Methylococcaceae bacterium]|nr:S41 family peptidase [Methylococcaceae bacterium]